LYDLKQALGRLFGGNIGSHVAKPKEADVGDGQNAVKDKDNIAGQPEPLQDLVGATPNIFEHARVVVTDVDGVIELDDAEREQCCEDHPGETEIERPEADLSGAIRPVFFLDDVAQAEERQAYREHPIDAIMEA